MFFFSLKLRVKVVKANTKSGIMNVIFLAIFHEITKNLTI